MKAQPRAMLSLLAEDRPFVVPIFQRRYAWRVADVAELLDDVITAGMNETLTRHFTGTVVHVHHRDAGGDAAHQRQLIDGQQRLTTLTLLLSALARACDARTDAVATTREAIERSYLFREAGDPRHRLQLTQADRPTLAALLDGTNVPRDAAAPLVDAQRYLVERLMAPDLDLGAVWQGAGKLTVVEVELQATEDDPQVVFESLNSKGLELAQADLVRNYVLMQFPVSAQEAMFAGYSRPLQDALSANASSRDGLDAMLRQYATLRTGRAVGTRATYAELKRVHLTSGARPEAFLADLHKHALVFARITRPVEADLDVREALEGLNRLDVDTARPLLMKLVAAWDDGAVTTDELLRGVRTLQAFVLRRRVCSLPTASLNQLVARLAHELPADGTLVDGLVHALANGRELDRFPSDFEFEQALRSRPIYLSRDLTRFALAELENHGRKEPVNVSEFTIEHVLPQAENLSPAWTEMLGENWREVLAKYLHTLGNLTLTGYNSELSARPFLEKRNMEGGFRDSPIRLNRALAKLERWDEDAIVARTNELVRSALRIWPVPAEATALAATLQEAAATPPDPRTDITIDTDAPVLDALLAAVQRTIPDVIEHRTPSGMVRLRVGGADPALHEFATLTPGDEPEVRVRLSADELADPERLFDWPPLGIGYAYPSSDAARLRLPSHAWIPKAVQALVQAAAARVEYLKDAPLTPAQRLAALVDALRDRLPPGLEVRDPIRPTFAILDVAGWPREMHYELSFRRGAPVVMLHFELGSGASGRDALREAFDALAAPLTARFGDRLGFRQTRNGEFAVPLPVETGPDEVLISLEALVEGSHERLHGAVLAAGAPQHP